MIPKYDGGSIVNIMSSIAQSFGKRSQYPFAHLLPPVTLQKKVILMVIDGLGYNYLIQHGKNTFFKKNLLGSVTSVFPSATAAAVTTFLTGLAPAHHGITGWYMHMRELGGVIAPLPFTFRQNHSDITKGKLTKRALVDESAFRTTLHAKTAIVMPNTIIPKSRLKKGVYSYRSLSHFIRQTQTAIHKKRYVYAYWPMFDTLAHQNGVQSKILKKHCTVLNNAVARLCAKLKNTTLIITADHGLLNAKTLFLEDYPKLKECLSQPLCGEPRAVYCYVRPSHVAQFKQYVSQHLRKYCTLKKSTDIIHYYGRGKVHPELESRIGDYVLLMKENYVLVDKLWYGRHVKLKGHHGGVSEDEMLVPLIVVNT